MDVYQARINRWHDKKMDLMSFTIGLLFTLALAFLGFVFDQHDDAHNFKNLFSVRCCLYLSLFFGFCALFTRFIDFQLTFSVAKRRKENYKLQIPEDEEHKEVVIPKSDKKIEETNNITRYLGNGTWVFFFLQAITFLLALSIYILNAESA